MTIKQHLRKTKEDLEKKSCARQRKDEKLVSTFVVTYNNNYESVLVLILEFSR